MKKIILLFSILLLILLLDTNAISLSEGDILNTTVSNSSMTFPKRIVCDRVEITPIVITLENCVCETGKRINQEIWSSPNDNINSSVFCEVIEVPIFGSGKGAYTGYNISYMCNKTEAFLQKYTINYTEEQLNLLYESVKNDLGFYVNKYILKNYIENYESICEKPIKEEITEEKRKGMAWYWWILIFIIILIIIFAVIRKK